MEFLPEHPRVQREHRVRAVRTIPLLHDEDFPDDEAILRQRHDVHNNVVGMVAEARWYGARFLIEMADHVDTHVASNTMTSGEWQPSVFLSGDIPEKVAEIKQSQGPDLHVWGSGNLIQTLIETRHR